MTVKKELPFSEQTLNLEIDFEGSAGIQRFAKVSDFKTWLKSENEFWGWLNEVNQSQINHTADLVKDAFSQYHRHCAGELSSANSQWSSFTEHINQWNDQILDEKLSEQQQDEISKKIDEAKKKKCELLENLKHKLVQILKTEMVSHRNHILRIEPEAEFVKELSDKNPMEAAFALDQFIRDKKNGIDLTSSESAGRMLAAMFSHNLNKKVRTHQKAFKTATETWQKELGDFKERYETLEKSFTEVAERHQVAETSWTEKRTEIETEHAQQLEKQEKELQNLYAKYDGFMKLKGPREYWEAKKKEHSRGKIIFGILVIVATGIGGYFLYNAAQSILPEAHDSSTIPWRNLGLFALLSTFVLWGIKLLSKIFLSHVHLYIDAREREVMIATFLALLEREESKASLTREDLAIVPAPIFRPSTTGVIKDDGGPMNILDYAGKLAGR